MSKERRVTVYNCKDGYLIHDQDRHEIYIYRDAGIEKVESNKTIKEVLAEL